MTTLTNTRWDATSAIAAALWTHSCNQTTQHWLQLHAICAKMSRISECYRKSRVFCEINISWTHDDSRCRRHRSRPGTRTCMTSADWRSARFRRTRPTPRHTRHARDTGSRRSRRSRRHTRTCSCQSCCDTCCCVDSDARSVHPPSNTRRRRRTSCRHPWSPRSSCRCVLSAGWCTSRWRGSRSEPRRSRCLKTQQQKHNNEKNPNDLSLHHVFKNALVKKENSQVRVSLKRLTSADFTALAGDLDLLVDGAVEGRARAMFARHLAVLTTLNGDNEVTQWISSRSSKQIYSMKSGFVSKGTCCCWLTPHVQSTQTRSSGWKPSPCS